MFEKAGELPKAYIRSRDALTVAKKAGDPDQAKQIFDSQFQPASVASQEVIKQLVQSQRDELDAASARVTAANRTARAGEQGRGFAVVASEVCSLAQRSAEAAKEIKNLIVASVQRVTDGIAEISAASREQSDGIHQINAAVTQLDQMTQQNAALVEQSAAAAESLRDQSGRLSEAISVFKLSATPAAAARSLLSNATPSKPSFKATPKLLVTKPSPARPVAATKAAPKPASQPAPRPAAVAATAGGDDEWASF